MRDGRGCMDVDGCDGGSRMGWDVPFVFLLLC